MSRHPLAAPRWIVAHVLVVVATVAFVLLGFWQLDRWGEERALEQALDQRLGAAPVALSEVVGRDVTEVEHLPVRATGTYLVDEEVLLRSRSHAGRSGYHVVTPLVMEDGRAVLVNRGWVPFEHDQPPVEEALPPPEATVTGVVVASTPRPGGFGPTDPEEGELERMFHADVDRIAQQVDVPLLPLLVQLTEQQPPQGGSLPIAASLPAADPTQNLGYAVQWFSFAVIAVVGYGAVLRRTGARTSDDVREPAGA